MPHSFHLPNQEADIVDRAKFETEQFARPVQMVNIRSGIRIAGVTVAGFV